MVKDTQRGYPTVTQSGATKWVTRDIAALDFLLNIPMASQVEIVRTGWERQGQPTATGKWWEGYTTTTATNGTSKEPEAAAVLLEGPAATTVAPSGGRRLEGDAAVKVQIPLTATSKSTRQRYIARQAQIREWELQVAQEQDVLSGRVFFSAKDNYPVSVFSVIKYEPKREEAARRRKKLEARGGGGTKFVVPERDWRGTSYRALLPRVERKHRGFNRFLNINNQSEDEDRDDDSFSSDDSEEEDTYVPGFLDDPEMRQGRHRHVMIGDRVSGCIVSSTIQFVKPAELKADLNKQFRERFDGWEPPVSQHKYIGAKVIDGVYTLIDPTEENEDEENIHMPPSLTLSKIRSLKQQALLAAVDAHLEVSTVALAFVYFERLCLDCRVDKSNRRLAFAACLLLAAKINEANISLVMQKEDDEKNSLQSLIRPTKKSNSIFASLLEFFTQDWSLSLKHLFSAEWGVFAALGFKLQATPSQVEFHFLRLMKVLGWNGLAYLGHGMYTQWQECLEVEERRWNEREERREMHREKKERKLIKLELKRQKEEKEWQDNDRTPTEEDYSARGKERLAGSPSKPKQQTAAMKLLNRFANLGRPSSTMERNSIIMPNDRLAVTTHESVRRSMMIRSGSLTFLAGKAQSAPASPKEKSAPASPKQHVAIDIQDSAPYSGNSSLQAQTDDEEEGIML